MTETASGSPSIKDYIQAGYPCLFLPTVEAEVAERRIKEALLDQELDMAEVEFGVWKATTGLMVGRVDSEPGDRSNKAEDFVNSLDYVEKATKPVVVIFHNVRKFIDNYINIQQLIDSTMSARLRGSHIILVGAFLDLPLELKSLVTFVDCPLPTQGQIIQQYDKIITAYADEIDVPKDKTERDELIRHAATAAVGLDSMGTENALALSLATKQNVNIKVIQAQKEQEVRKSDVLEFISTDETMDMVGGFKAFKVWLTRRQRVFTDEARKYGLPYPKGMLIVGVAGSGKSLAAKASASFLKLPLLRLDMGKVFRSLVGESEGAIRMALSVTEAVSPVVLWMDEIDKGLAGSAGSGELDSGVSARVVSTILTWRQETKYPVILVATANNVLTIPSMVYRKGRLDEVWATDLPFIDEREEIFKIHLLKRNRDPKKFDCAVLAEAAEEMVGAEIESVIEDALFAAFDKGVEITQAHILKAIRETKPQAQRNREEIEAVREWVTQRARLVSAGERPGTKKSKVRQIKRRRDN